MALFNAIFMLFSLLAIAQLFIMMGVSLAGKNLLRDYPQTFAVFAFVWLSQLSMQAIRIFLL